MLKRQQTQRAQLWSKPSPFRPVRLTGWTCPACTTAKPCRRVCFPHKMQRLLRDKKKTNIGDQQQTPTVACIACVFLFKGTCCSETPQAFPGTKKTLKDLSFLLKNAHYRQNRHIFLSAAGEMRGKNNPPPHHPPSTDAGLKHTAEVIKCCLILLCFNCMAWPHFSAITPAITAGKA